MRNGKIDRYLFEGGYAQATATGSDTGQFAFYYYNQDHLGNNREVVDASGVVQQVTNYYPFGAPYADSSSSKNANKQQYKYNGKELDRMHGLDTYDYGARQHDPILARWDRIDPLCEKYYSISPYAYCANNPVRYVDPTGEFIAIFDEDNNMLTFDYDSGKFMNDGEAYNGNNDYINSVTKWLNQLMEGGMGNALVENLANRPEGTLLQEAEAGKGSEQKAICNELAEKRYGNGMIGSIVRLDGSQVADGSDAVINLAHELAHSKDYLDGTMNENSWGTKTYSEAFAMHVENMVRVEQNSIAGYDKYPIRVFYGTDNMRGAYVNRDNCSSVFFRTNSLANPLPKGGKYQTLKPKEGYVYTNR